MMTEKRCPRCKTTKPSDQFYRDSNRKSGLNPYCIPCIRQVGIESRNRHGDLAPKLSRDKRKLALINSLGGKCSGCGLVPSKDWPVACFDFHHESNKELHMAKILMLEHSFDAAQEESKKCIVFCSNCHRKHHSNKSRSKLHGVPVSVFENSGIPPKP